MNKPLRRILLPFFLTLVSGLQAQEVSLLWRISGNGLEQPSFLFGTVHLIPKDSFFFPALYQEKFDSCSLYVTEVVLKPSFAEQLSIASEAALPDGKTMRDYMKPQEYARFYSYHVDSLGISTRKMAKIIRLKPIFGSGLILEEILPPSTSYEMRLLKRARKMDMTNYGLESLKDQMAAINKISIQDQMPDSGSYENYKQEYYEMIALYRQQRVDSLYTLTRSDTTAGKDFDKFLLDERNRSWMKRMESLMEYKPSFIAVGAAHLWGEEGVINLLRKRGYKVIPVYAEPNGRHKRK